MKIPGTVSKILWHFTGGPIWDEETKRQKSEPKPINETYAIVKQILDSKELRISKYKELLKVVIPDSASYVYYDGTRERTIESSSVCCLTDIPMQHLHYHAQRYGKCAIGFHRESAIRRNFNPVFYLLHDSRILHSIYDGLSSILYSEIESNLKWLSEMNESYGDNRIKEQIARNLDDFKTDLEAARISLEDFSAFIKTFSPEEFNTIYTEREWRSLLTFKFVENDIAMVVVPRENGCYDDLIKTNIISDKIPIIPWEDLIEH